MLVPSPSGGGSGWGWVYPCDSRKQRAHQTPRELRAAAVRALSRAGDIERRDPIELDERRRFDHGVVDRFHRAIERQYGFSELFRDQQRFARAAGKIAEEEDQCPIAVDDVLF